MSRLYCEICREPDDTGLGICSDCQDESDLEDNPYWEAYLKQFKEE